jgi:hypothetical protein
MQVIKKMNSQVIAVEKRKNLMRNLRRVKLKPTLMMMMFLWMNSKMSLFLRIVTKRERKRSFRNREKGDITSDKELILERRKKRRIQYSLTTYPKMSLLLEK